MVNLTFPLVSWQWSPGKPRWNTVGRGRPTWRAEQEKGLRVHLEAGSLKKCPEHLGWWRPSGLRQEELLCQDHSLVKVLLPVDFPLLSPPSVQKAISLSPGGYRHWTSRSIGTTWLWGAESYADSGGGGTLCYPHTSLQRFGIPSIIYIFLMSYLCDQGLSLQSEIWGVVLYGLNCVHWFNP